MDKGRLFGERWRGVPFVGYLCLRTPNMAASQLPEWRGERAVVPSGGWLSTDPVGLSTGINPDRPVYNQPGTAK